MLTAARLREVLSYDPATGLFRWRATRDGVKAGSFAGRTRGRYNQICVHRKFYQASHLAWLYMTDKWPKREINYINGNRFDTRWGNLREITPSQRRAIAPTRNKLGVKGVWITKNGKYVARISVNAKKNISDRLKHSRKPARLTRRQPKVPLVYLRGQGNAP